MQRNAACLAGRKAACVLPDVLSSTFLPSSPLVSSTRHHESTSTIFSQLDPSLQSSCARHNRATHRLCCPSAPFALGRTHAHLAAAEATPYKDATHGPSSAEVARTLLEKSGCGILSTTGQCDTPCSTYVHGNCLVITLAQSNDDDNAARVARTYDTQGGKCVCMRCMHARTAGMYCM